MSEIPYTLNTGKIPEIFRLISQTGVPNEATRNWLETLGFTSSADRSLLKILRYIQFIDDQSKPTEYWTDYRVPSKSQYIMAMAVKEGYKELFNIYPDAYRKDKEALYAFFATKTSVSEKTITYMIRTFESLVELSDFEAIQDEILLDREKGRKGKEIQEQIETIIKSKSMMPNINITINLPATDDIKIYENIMKSIKKYLILDEE